MSTTSELPEKLNVLKVCFASLPESLPESVGDTSQFYIDPEDACDIGTSGALNKVFHRVWGYKDRGLKIVSRGPQLLATLRLLEDTIPVADDCGIVGLWIDALIKVAEVAGGSRLQREAQTIATPSHGLQVQGKRQTTLSFARIPVKEYHEQVRNCTERAQEERKLEPARALEEAADVKRRKREKERLRK